MNFWKIILATVVIFGAGVMSGGLLVNHVNHPRRFPNHREPPYGDNHFQGDAHEPQSRTNGWGGFPHPPRAPEILGDRFTQQLDDALHLTSDQCALIQKIIADGQERSRAIWTNNSAQMRVVAQDVRHRVREALTADQQKQFEELMRRVPRRPNSTNPPPNFPPVGRVPMPAN